MANAKTTKCIVCGKTVEYTTKQPKWCADCKALKSTPKKAAGKSKNTTKTKWKNESLMFKILDELLPKTHYCINGYYSWLPSPHGSPMQLDWYSYELGLAFEYEGPQHYTYSKYFHKKKSDFYYLQECDKLKKELCDKEGVMLVSFKYTTELTVRNLALELKRTNAKTYNALLKEGMLNLTKEDIDYINSKGEK